MHLFVILIIALLVFSPGKPGEIGGQRGKGMREFKQSMQELDRPESPAGVKKTDSEKIAG
jgi:sec-independent protein translocase protein TatA